jgi:hypothetical protein
MKPEALFLLSAPRSGSTLLQRLLGAHAEIATVSEPWLLLPLLYALRDRGVYAEYAHVDLVRALDDFCAALPNGRRDWDAEVREFALRLYARAGGGSARYFLDKTPRYALVADELFRAFPDARFVFLWRHPLAVVASILETWGRGRWNLHYFKADVFDGVERLVAAARAHGERAVALRYEDLVREPEKQLRSVLSYLDLDWQPDVLSGFGGVALRGRMGDRVGVERYAAISDGSMRRWTRVLSNPLRRAWARRYLRWLGAERLALMGYDLAALEAELDAVPATRERLGSDLAHMGYGLVYSALELRLLRHKLEQLPEWRRIYGHR